MKLHAATGRFYDNYMSTKYTRRDTMWGMIEKGKKPFNKVEMTKYDDLNREVMMFEDIVKEEVKVRALVNAIKELVVDDSLPDLTTEERNRIFEKYKELI